MSNIYKLDAVLDLGFSHFGGALSKKLVAEVELTDEEVATIRKLVKTYQGDAEKCGLLPILENGAPELYEKIDEAIYGEVYDYFVLDGLRNGFFDLDDQMAANYERDKEEGIVDDYEFWCCFEREKMEEDLGYLHSRYDIGDQLNTGDENYYCHIPTFAKE